MKIGPTSDPPDLPQPARAPRSLSAEWLCRFASSKFIWAVLWLESSPFYELGLDTGDWERRDEL